MKPYTIVRAKPQHLVSTAMWRTPLESDGLLIVCPPTRTQEDLADELLEIAMQLKGIDQ